MFISYEAAGSGRVKDANVDKWVALAEAKGAEFQTGFVTGLNAGLPNLASLVASRLPHVGVVPGIPRVTFNGDGLDRVGDVLEYCGTLSAGEAKGVLMGALQVLPANVIAPLAEAYRRLDSHS